MAAAEVLGLTGTELRAKLRAGASPADVAEQQGVSRDALATALVDAATSCLADAVQAGRLTRAQADERTARLPERIDAAVDRSFWGSGHGWPDADESPPAPSPSADQPTG